MRHFFAGNAASVPRLARLAFCLIRGGEEAILLWAFCLFEEHFLPNFDRLVKSLFREGGGEKNNRVENLPSARAKRSDSAIFRAIWNDD